MDQDTINKILSYLGYELDEDNQVKCTIDCSGEAENNCCKDFNSDLFDGFQDLNPILFIVIGELIGNVLSGGLPINVSSSIANLLNFVGQIIETYAAQQFYFQSGPGRNYNLNYRNVSNPFCSVETVSNNDNKIEEMKKTISELEEKIKELENKIESD